MQFESAQHFRVVLSRAEEARRAEPDSLGDMKLWEVIRILALDLDADLRELARKLK